MKSSPLRITLSGGLVLAVAILSGCQSGSLSKLTPTLPNSITRLWGVDNDMRLSLIHISEPTRPY